MRRYYKFACALIVLLAAGCTTIADKDGEAAKSAALDTSWLAMAAAGDAAGIGDLYSSDGTFMSKAPVIIGPKKIADAWADLMKLPGISITFETVQLDIAKPGDLAMDRGSYELRFDGESGPVRDVGKFIVVWKKVAGEWKVAADIFNSDLKAP